MSGVALEFVTFMSGLLAAVSLLVSFAYRCCEGHWPWQDEKPRPEHRALNAACDVIAASIIDHPNEWSITRHHLTNSRRKLSIWIANEDYGLGIATEGASASPNDGALPKKARRTIWKAVLTRKSAALVASFREQS